MTFCTASVETSSFTIELRHPRHLSVCGQIWELRVEGLDNESSIAMHDTHVASFPSIPTTIHTPAPRPFHLSCAVGCQGRAKGLVEGRAEGQAEASWYRDGR